MPLETTFSTVFLHSDMHWTRITLNIFTCPHKTLMKGCFFFIFYFKVE